MEDSADTSTGGTTSTSDPNVSLLWCKYSPRTEKDKSTASTSTSTTDIDIDKAGDPPSLCSFGPACRFVHSAAQLAQRQTLLGDRRLQRERLTRGLCHQYSRLGLSLILPCYALSGIALYCIVLHCFFCIALSCLVMPCLFLLMCVCVGSAYVCIISIYQYLSVSIATNDVTLCSIYIAELCASTGMPVGLPMLAKLSRIRSE
jgi:hypothetical protein